jgi:DNA-binding transcriptional ArsR family regulator
MEDQFKEIAALIGEPTRATIMWALLEGKAFTATELAIAADTSAQNISMHLSKLVNADLLCVETQGRHRYYRYSRDSIAHAIESIASLAPRPAIANDKLHESQSPIKYCRTCYDHIAGKVGVAITDGLLNQKIIIKIKDDFTLGIKARALFADIGIDVDDLKLQRRPLIRPCLDWSERRHHIAGSLSAALLNKMLSSGWVRKIKNSRALIITGLGEKIFNDRFKISL